MINNERTLNIYTTVLLDGLKTSKFVALSQREREIIVSAQKEFVTLTFKDTQNISTGFFKSPHSNIIPVLLLALFNFKKQKNDAISLINLLDSLNSIISDYINGTLEKNSKEYHDVISFLEYFNNEYNKKVYLSNIHNNSLIYA